MYPSKLAGSLPQGCNHGGGARPPQLLCGPSKLLEVLYIRLCVCEVLRTQITLLLAAWTPPNCQHVVAPLGLGSRTPMKIGYPRGTNLASVQSPKMCTGLGDSARTRPLLDSARLGLGLCLDSARLGLGLCWTRLGSDSDLVDST